MSFFQDLKNAAKDLSEHGLNLDNLQEEVGCEKREPLPALPPTRGETQTVMPAAAAPEDHHAHRGGGERAEHAARQVHAEGRARPRVGSLPIRSARQSS